VQNVGDEIGDEVEKYFSLGVVTSSSFIDVMEWWTARKDVFPAHYQMAADYLGTPATLTPSERVNSMAGRESQPRGKRCHRLCLSKQCACVLGLTQR
jgi:hypothetical protein